MIAKATSIVLKYLQKTAKLPSVTDLYREKHVREVLKAFETMGADTTELKDERRKLETDDLYLSDWVAAVRPKKRFEVDL